MSNLPPGFHEPPEHDPRCEMACDNEDCPLVREDHTCTCDELHEQDAEREAEAYVDWLYDTTP